MNKRIEAAARAYAWHVKGERRDPTQLEYEVAEDILAAADAAVLDERATTVAHDLVKAETEPDDTAALVDDLCDPLTEFSMAQRKKTADAINRLQRERDEIDKQAAAFVRDAAGERDNMRAERNSYKAAVKQIADHGQGHAWYDIGPPARSLIKIARAALQETDDDG